MKHFPRCSDQYQNTYLLPLAGFLRNPSFTSRFTRPWPTVISTPSRRAKFGTSNRVMSVQAKSARRQRHIACNSGWQNVDNKTTIHKTCIIVLVLNIPNIKGFIPCSAGMPATEQVCSVHTWYIWNTQYIRLYQPFFRFIAEKKIDNLVYPDQMTDWVLMCIFCVMHAYIAVKLLL